VQRHKELEEADRRRRLKHEVERHRKDPEESDRRSRR
jgi:hypothetical protein